MPKIFLFAVLLTTITLSSPLRAALPKDVRQDLSAMTKEARTVTRLIRKKQIDEAREIVARLSERATELKIADDERDRSWKSFQKELGRARNALPVSFENEIAPILKDNCFNCHGDDDTRANLRLTTFANLRRGGRSGLLLRPHNAAASLLMQRLTAADPQQRMPRNADRLPDDQLKTVARWIEKGADFDGTDEAAAIGSSANGAVAPSLPSNEPVNVVMSDGTETVSFKDDIAPWMVNICLRCHQGNEPRGGFSVATFEDVLRDGDTGGTIAPGDSDGSYIWHLVGLQDPIKMPPNNLLLKRSQARALKTWIDEGARFDGPDPRAPLRNLVPTEAEKEALRLSDMSDGEFNSYRNEQAESLWKRAVSGETPRAVTSKNFYVYGTQPVDRLQQLADQAEAQLNSLQNQQSSAMPAWKGKLILFVCSTRFDYEEFNTVLLDRRTPPAMSGHVVITASQAIAYAVLQDDDSAARPGSMTTDQQVRSLVSQAWLLRNRESLPDWLQLGFGRVESGISEDELTHLRQAARGAIAVAGINNPADIFQSGRFGPAETVAVGTLLTRYLKSQGTKSFRQFLNTVTSSADAAQTIEAAWNKPADAVAREFIQWLAR